MGRKSGISKGGFDPRIWAMHRSMELRDQLSYRNERIMTKKKMSLNYWKQRLANAMWMIRDVDQNNWETWYDNNTPDVCTFQERTLMVEARVKELLGRLPACVARVRHGIFIWQDQHGTFVYSKEGNEDALYPIEFDTFAEAEVFVNGLPANNCGYGVVLNILPATFLQEAQVES